MTIGIYCYENKHNHRRYIGQSTNIEKRYDQHLYDAANRPKQTIDFALNKFGIDDFDFMIIEECSEDRLNEREIYWIQYYDSYNDGYNSTPGGKCLRGENHPRAFLSDDDVYAIREEYAKGTPRREVYSLYQAYSISERGFKKIWDGETWPHIHMDVYTEENKAKHRKNTGHSTDQVGLSSLDRAIKQEEIDSFVQDYEAGMNIYQISKKHKRDYGVIQKYLNNPVANQSIKYNGRKVQNVNTGKIFDSISSAAKWAKCGATTLTRHLQSDRKAGTVPETGEKAEWIEIL